MDNFAYHNALTQLRKVEGKVSELTKRSDTREYYISQLEKEVTRLRLELSSYKY